MYSSAELRVASPLESHITFILLLQELLSLITKGQTLQKVLEPTLYFHSADSHVRRLIGNIKITEHRKWHPLGGGEYKNVLLFSAIMTNVVLPEKACSYLYARGQDH